MRAHLMWFDGLPSSSPRLAAVIAVAAGCIAGLASGRDNADDAALLGEATSLFQPLPKDMSTAKIPLTPKRVRLGRTSFFDRRISADGTVSCSRCHLPALYATDGLPKSVGAHGKVLPRNAPTRFRACSGAPGRRIWGQSLIVDRDIIADYRCVIRAPPETTAQSCLG